MVEFWELRWLVRESSSLKFAVLCRASHGTDYLAWRIISLSSESIELIGEYFCVIFDIVPREYISAVKNLDDILYMLPHRWTECDILIVYTIDLGSSKWDRNRRLDEDIVSRDLSIYSIFILTFDRCELDDMRLADEITSLRSESCSFCIPDGDFHKKGKKENFSKARNSRKKKLFDVNLLYCKWSRKVFSGREVRSFSGMY